MPLICENVNTLSAHAADATTVAPPVGAELVLLEEADLTILRLIAAGRRRPDIAADTFSTVPKTDARTRRLCRVLHADNRAHLAALGTVYGLVTRDHLPSLPGSRPHVDEDDQDVLDLVAAGVSESRIAARFQCNVHRVHKAIARLAFAFGADNRCQLAAHAVLVEAVTYHAVSPRFPRQPLSGLPPFHVTWTGTGVLLHGTPPQPLTDSALRSPGIHAEAVPVSAPVESGRSRTGHARARGDMAPIPTELATWVTNHVGRHPTWALPNDGSGARSWRLSSPEGIIELRVPRTHGDLQREVSAHRHAVGRLGAGRAPRLVGFDPRLRALLTREPRGERVDHAPDRGLHLRESVHEQAGLLLRVLHESTVGARDRQAQASETTLRYVDYIDRVLDRIKVREVAGHRQGIRRRLAPLREVLPQLPGAFCHGSFGFGVWRWQRATQSLALTGFTRSQMMAAVVDFARPSVLWTGRPALQDAFARGYGRPLGELERELLGDFAILAAVEDLWHATSRTEPATDVDLVDALRALSVLLPEPGAAPDDGTEERPG